MEQYSIETLTKKYAVPEIGVNPEKIVNYDLVPFPRGLRGLFLNRQDFLRRIFVSDDLFFEKVSESRTFQVSSMTVNRNRGTLKAIERSVIYEGDMYVFSMAKIFNEDYLARVDFVEFHPSVELI